MYTCQNQPCRAKWQAADLEFVNEGQGYFYRCPICGARNKVEPKTLADGSRIYEQASR
jgi:hypothetical protein